MTTYDDELNVIGLRNELHCGTVAYDTGSKAHVWIALPPTGEALGQNCFGLLLACRPVRSGHIAAGEVVPGVQRHEIHFPAARFLEADLRCRIGRGRPVNADQHGQAGRIGCE